MNGKLARLGHEEITVNSDKVAVVEQAEDFPALFDGRAVVIVYGLEVIPAHVNLQARDSVREMHERCFAHHAGRRADASADADFEVIQLFVRGFELFGRRTLSLFELREMFRNLFMAGNRRHCIFAFNALCNVAALKLVRVDIADELAQRV